MGVLQPTRSRSWGPRARGALPGLLLAALGATAAWVCLGLPFRLPSGRPGPGFVPLLVAAALACLGLMLATTGAFRGRVASGLPARPGIALCAAVLAFGLLLPLGFIPATWAAGSLALLATPGMPAWQGIAGGLGLALLAATLFLGLLGIPAPLLGPR